MKKEVIKIYLTPTEKKKLTKRAAKQRRSVSTYVGDILKEGGNI